jgi:hypothetical protein
MPTTPQNNLLQNVANGETGPINESQLGSNQMDPVWFPRPIISTLDTWDDNTRLDYNHSVPSTGTRPLFNVPSIAVTSESVNTISASSFTQQNNPSVATNVAVATNPTTSLVAFRNVPTMAQNLYVTSNVQVSFSLLISTVTASSPRFKIYRDGQPLSQQYQQLTGGSNVHSLVSGSFIDTNPTLLKYHVYDLRWAANDVTVTGYLSDRTFQASNLRAT